MTPEAALAVLYDLALVVGSEVEVDALLRAVLQRLLYHTGFPVGLAIEEGRLTEVLGDRELARRRGEEVGVPAGGAVQQCRDPALLAAFSGRRRYAFALVLPVDPTTTLVLLATREPDAALPSAELFVPALPPLARSLQLLRSNASLHQSLRAELETRREAEEALRRTRDEALAASRAKTTFLATVSHEVRTPLNAVLGFAHLLEAELGEPQLDKVRRIGTAARALLATFDELLDLAALETGELPIESVPVDVASLCDHVVEQHAGAARARHLSLTAHVDARLRGTALLGDPVRLAQILTHLVANGLKFTPSGSVAVSVGLDEAPGWVRFDVVDTGIGIPGEQAESLFEPFRQLDGSTARRFGGAGIGLALARSLARRLGGDLSVVPTPAVPGQPTSPGSRFRLRVPLLPVTGSLRELRGLQVRRGARVVLWCEDPIHRSVTHAALCDAGLEVELADSGPDAGRRVLAGGLDLAVVDGGGPDRVSAWRAGGVLHPIVALVPEGADVEALRRAGVDDVATTPLDPRRFRALLARWVPARTPGAALEAPVLDLAEGLRHFDGEVEEYDLFLERFARRYRDEGGRIEVALATDGHREAARLAHSLKSVAATLGLGGVRRTAAELEAALRQEGDPRGVVQSLIRELQRAVDAILSRHRALAPAAVDPRHRRELLSRLITLLDEDDVNAADVWQELKQLLTPSPGVDRVDVLVEAFDFPSARGALRALSRSPSGDLRAD